MSSVETQLRQLIENWREEASEWRGKLKHEESGAAVVAYVQGIQSTFDRLSDELEAVLDGGSGKAK